MKNYSVYNRSKLYCLKELRPLTVIMHSRNRRETFLSRKDASCQSQIDTPKTMRKLMLKLNIINSRESNIEISKLNIVKKTPISIKNEGIMKIVFYVLV